MRNEMRNDEGENRPATEPLHKFWANSLANLFGLPCIEKEETDYSHARDESTPSPPSNFQMTKLWFYRVDRDEQQCRRDAQGS